MRKRSISVVLLAPLVLTACGEAAREPAFATKDGCMKEIDGPCRYSPSSGGWIAPSQYHFATNTRTTSSSRTAPIAPRAPAPRSGFGATAVTIISSGG